jgi:hypothetical protein
MMLRSNEKQSHSPKMMNIVQYSLTEWLAQGLWGGLFYFYNIYIYIFCLVSQVLCSCTDDRYGFGMKSIFFFFHCNDSIFFFLIIWWGIGIASESKLEVLKDSYFSNHNCFYYFFFFCLITLFYYYSNIPYVGG